MKHSIKIRFAVLLVATVFALAYGFQALAQHYGPAVAVLAGISLLQLPHAFKAPSFTLGAIGNLADLWTPPIWINGMRERAVQRLSLLNSGAVRADTELQALADGPGVEIVINHLRDPNHDDEPQVESTAPGINNIGKSQQKAPVLNRVSTMGTSALAQHVSGANPLGAILDSAAGLRDRQRQRTLLNILRGVFGFSTAPDATTAALYQLRYDAFSETGASPGASQLLDTTKLLTAIHQFGENVVEFAAAGGAIVMHSAIALALQIQDQITEVRNSEGTLIMYSWKGLPIFISDLLRRAGTTSGFVFDTYVLAPGSIGKGEKAQSSTVGDLASLILDLTQVAKNDVTLYDRTRFALHVYGTKWTGTPAGSSASNAELATVGNWALGYSDYKNAGVVCIRTNG